ncbi:GDSL-type esterase/lipase family protein [Ferdinandcohnia quinoae]|uniref:GDSL-type esterase/lipase family protein n=1 Tax=Fredinandcohnia quinoae TaxID=2918902 RepID=A0AAW5DYV2_9BACI|nr:GDSL-type esterase/lipase family protein [Fredinandcohnia sp. SECRCQ15]MCH1625258.1 GDSL-type esterase/lipase family protein [Fredinandcohnia sp. SECRCQ15]
MRKNVQKRFWSLAFVIALLVGLIVPSASAAGTDPIRYLALGDSLAAGVTANQNGLGKSYTDMTAEALKSQGKLESFSKQFAVPGYTTENVLNDLTTKADLQEAVKKSDLITISAGANDFVKLLKIDREKGTAEIDPAVVPGTLESITKNFTGIIQSLKKLNPDAKIYVMGYYYPLPHISDAQRPPLVQVTKGLNQTIAATVTAQGANFVPVYDKFGDDAKQYLPNPIDIHPNEAGYQLLSEALLASITSGAPQQPVAKDIPVGHWAAKELNLLLANKLLSVDESGKIYPEKAITRAEAAGIIYQIIPTTKSIPANPGFIDVPENHPAYMAIAKLTEAGIFAKDKKFNPDAPLTRVQTAKIIASAFHVKGDGKIPAYKDISATYWAAPYIDAVADSKLMVGYSNKSFGLHDDTNRAQFAVIIVRALALQTK